jgi:hypothetical protein
MLFTHQDQVDVGLRRARLRRVVADGRVLHTAPYTAIRRLWFTMTGDFLGFAISNLQTRFTE